MQGSYGRLMYAVQNKQSNDGAYVPAVIGVPGDWDPVGAVSRFTPRIVGGIDNVPMIGAWAPMYTEGGTSWGASFTIDGVQDFELVKLGRRDPVTGELPWLSLLWGWKKGTDVFAYFGEDAKIESVALRCDAPGRVTADIALTGGPVAKTAVDPGDMSFFANRPYRSFNLTWDELIELYGIDVSWKNNLIMENFIAGTATSRIKDRLWDLLDEGGLDISGEIRSRGADVLLDLQDCLLASGTHVLALDPCVPTSPLGAASITISGLIRTDENGDFGARNHIVVGTPFVATDVQIA